MWIKNWFSNMLPMDKPINYQGILYYTSENYYQAMKLPKDRIDLRAQIAALEPHKAKRAIKDSKKYLWREDWTKELSIDVMKFILSIKFAPGTSWHKKLMETGEEEIVEWNNWNDLFWGKNVDTQQGENHLGIILMELREKYKND